MKIRTRLSSPETENPRKWAANATASLAAGSARLRALVAEWGVEAGKNKGKTAMFPAAQCLLFASFNLLVCRVAWQEQVVS